MARVYRNFKADMTTGGITAYTCPNNTKAIVLHCQVANIHITDTAAATVKWVDATDGTNTNVSVHWISNVDIPIETALSVITGKPILEANDTIVATASANSKLYLSGSVLEIS